MIKLWKPVACLVIFIACNPSANLVFEIKSNGDPMENFQQMVDADHFKLINEENASMLLYNNEWDAIEEADSLIERPIFKDYGEIIKTEEFTVHILLRMGMNPETKDYTFLARTYGENKIIDSYEVAVWNEVNDKFCIGSVNDKLLIERKCDNSDIIDVVQISQEGKMVINTIKM